jgi:hypothetical protein
MAMSFGPALPMNRANLRCLGLSVGIAIALAGCAKYPEGAPAAKDKPTQGAYIYVADGEFGRLKKVCDEGRAIYWVDSSYRGSAIFVIDHAPDCDGNKYVADK